MKCNICGEEAEDYIDSNECLRIDIGEFVCKKCCDDCPFAYGICDHHLRVIKKKWTGPMSN